MKCSFSCSLMLVLCVCVFCVCAYAAIDDVQVELAAAHTNYSLKFMEMHA